MKTKSEVTFFSFDLNSLHDQLSVEQKRYALAKQVPAMDSYIRTSCGDLYLDYELKEAVKRTLSFILEKRLKAHADFESPGSL